MSIKVENLHYIYSEGLPYETVALDGVSFEAADGEFLGVIGHTGSGKSTLMQHLNGILKPKSGRIFVGDTEITAKGAKLAEIRRKIGLVFQYPEYQLFEETVYKDIAFGPGNLGLEADEIERTVRESMALVGLDFDEFGSRSPFELSGGQKRRAAIAGVLAMSPEVLILDEPTAGLDPAAHRDFLRMIREIQAERQIIVFLVSHNMGDIAEFADRVLVMHEGKLALSGTPREVFAKSAFLASIGLGIPPVMEFAQKLRFIGLDIEDDPLTLEDAELMLDRILLAG